MAASETWFVGLDRALAASLAPYRSGRDELGLLFSGGIDSALLAWELRKRPGLRLFTVGTEGSPDLRAAALAARVLELPWEGAVVTAGEVETIARRVAPELAGTASVARSVLTAFAVAVARAHSVRLLCGQGADELFLGYAHFRGLDPAEAARRAREDLERLRKEDWPRAQRVAARLGRSVDAPYLEPGFVLAASGIPLPLRMPGSEPKALLRAWAVHRGLSAELAQRPKRALQYGSGIDRLLRRARG